MPTLHHLYGPSTHDKLEVCPGFKNDQTRDSTAADRGTLLHTVRETGNFELCANDEDAEYVRRCIAYIDTVKKAIVGAEQHDEVRLEICDGLCFGTADCIVLPADHSCAHYFDTKFAWKKQQALPDNRQMKSYVAGIFEDYESVKAVKVHVLYPQLGFVETHTYYRSELQKLKLEIFALLKRVEYFNRSGDTNVLNPTMEVCGYCARAGGCAKLHSWGVPLAIRYSALPELQEVHPSRITDPGEQAAKYYEVAELLEEMGKSAKKHLKELALANGGFKDKDGKVLFSVKTQNGPKEIADKVKLLEILQTDYNVNSDTVLAFSKPSLGDLIDHIAKEQAPKKGKTKFVAELENKLLESGAVVAGEPQLRVVRVKPEAAIDVASTVVTE